MKEAALFLASHLGELNELEDEHEKITIALSSIAAVYKQINETTLEMLLSQVSTPDNIKASAVSYFRGAEILDVLCDCHDDFCMLLHSNEEFWRQRGQHDMQSKAYAYTSTMEWINSLKDKLS